MSHRFPPLTPHEPSSPKARVRALTLPQAPSLPWLELVLGLALLVILRGF